jgi:hypothetical protein
LCSNAAFCLHCSQLNSLDGLTARGVRWHPVTKATLALTPEIVQGLDAVKRLLERGIEDDVSLSYADADRMMAVAYHGMRLLDVPAVERQAWLEKIRRRCRDKIRRSVMNKTFPDIEWSDYLQLQVHCAELLLEEGEKERAKQIFAEAQSEMPASFRPWGGMLEVMQAVVAKADDSRLLTDFQQGCSRTDQQQAHLIYLKWPTVDVLAGKGNLDAMYVDKGRSRLNVVEIRAEHPPQHHYPSRHWPLAEGGGRLYVLVSHSRTVIAYVSLDQRGRPVGNSAPNRYGTKIWDNMGSIPQPASGKDLHVTSARYIEGKLYLGTSGRFPGAAAAGLLVFDPKTETWKTYGPEQGLPGSSVDAFFPIGGQMLYCACSAGHYTLNLATGAVTLVHRGDTEAGSLINNNLRLLWHNAGRLMGASECGIWSDLLSKDARCSPLSNQTCYGWQMDAAPHMGIIAAAEADGRRFYFCRGGLYEIDAAGNTLRSWWTEYQLQPAGGGLGINTGLGIVAPADCPLQNLPRIYAIGSRLLFADYGQWTVYDPKSDTWYGPINSCGCDATLTAADGGLWGTMAPERALFYVPLGNVIACAEALGRVMTTTEYRRRNQQWIDAAKPLDRAKFALGMRQFDKATSTLQQVLDAEPNQPEALILMGFLHDRSGFNQPHEAITYYRRAAELENDPIASYSGMYLWLCVLKDRQEWRGAIDLCEKILRRYPVLDPRDRQRVQWFHDYSRQQLNATRATQPPRTGTGG